LDTALPEGSFNFLKDLSQLRAIGELQATDGTDGTVEADAVDGK
tara:strand:+ start:376 stop:507 length:132 start_codon:yes stop_codon:yes gene_type:complete